MNLLKSTLYDPAVAVSKATSALLAMTAFDTTNLRLAITVPAHGMVRFKMRVPIVGATTCPTVLLGVLNGAAVVGRVAPQYENATANAATQSFVLDAEFTATGLAPGAMNVDAAYAVQVLVASTNIKYGGPNTNAGANAWGGFLFEAWDPQPQTANSTLTVDSSGRVDVSKISGTTQTARDIGASVLLSAGTGAGQLDFTSGVVKANAVQLLGTAWLTPGTAGTPDVNTKLVGGTSQTAGDLKASLNTLQADTDDIQTRLPAALVSGRMDSSVGAMAANVLTATAINADAITAAKIADGAIDAATFAAGAINAAAIAADAITDAKVASDVTIASVTGAVGSVTGAVGSVTGAVGSVTGSVGSVTGNVGGNVAGSVASVTAAVTVGTINANVVTASALATSAVDEIADGVWDELLAGHAGVGSAGLALSTAGLAGGLDAAGVRAALGLASANLDTQLGAIAGYIDTEVAALSTDVGTVLTRLTAGRAALLDNLDVLLSSRLAGAAYTVPDNAAIAAVKAKTDSLTFTVPAKLDVNMLYVNGAAVIGAGTPGSPWGPGP